MSVLQTSCRFCKSVGSSSSCRYSFVVGDPRDGYFSSESARVVHIEPRVIRRMQAQRCLGRVTHLSGATTYRSIYTASRPSLYAQSRPLPRTAAFTNSLCRWSRCYASSSDDKLRQHASVIDELSACVAQFHSQKQKFRINHGSTNSTRQTSKGPHVLDVSALNRVLSVDAEKKIALVEPNVPMDR